MSDMKVCIVGAGAIGGFIGARLAASGVSTSVLARRDTLQALQTHGWRLHTEQGLIQAATEASDRAESLGHQDLVIIALKGQVLPELVASLKPLIGPNTLILPTMNGVPWWFCQSVSGFSPEPLRSVDPQGLIAEVLPQQQVIGVVVHASCLCPEPGVVRHVMGNGLIIGEPGGGHSERVHHVASMLAGAGFSVTESTDIRRDIWYKLWGNLTMNPVSAMTGATTEAILSDELVKTFCSDVMREAALIGARIGCVIDQEPDDRHAITLKLGAFKTSMLQDAEAGRALELDAIVSVVAEIATRLQIDAPNLRALLGLSRLFASSHGLYSRAGQ
ncbi:2-dehydropantoate 2-reductase [Pokkaliibacter plantistimulans]|nr:2-dehydropantoate 2-reductase [Pokkaliibacter plantistimulans]